MRIWSKKLIEFLPTRQLKAMRYELGDMIKQYPNIKNSIVKFANNYDIAYLGQYFGRVLREFDRRKLKHKAEYDNTILLIIDKLTKYSYQYIANNDLVFNEDDDEYLKICLWNLKEKRIRGSITYKEWRNIINNLVEEGIDVI